MQVSTVSTVSLRTRIQQYKPTDVNIYEEGLELMYDAECNVHACAARLAASSIQDMFDDTHLLDELRDAVSVLNMCHGG